MRIFRLSMRDGSLEPSHPDGHYDISFDANRKKKFIRGVVLQFGTKFATKSIVSQEIYMILPKLNTVYWSTHYSKHKVSVNWSLKTTASCFKMSKRSFLQKVPKNAKIAEPISFALLEILQFFKDQKVDVVNR